MSQILGKKFERPIQKGFQEETFAMLKDMKLYHF